MEAYRKNCYGSCPVCRVSFDKNFNCNCDEFLDHEDTKEAVQEVFEKATEACEKLASKKAHCLSKKQLEEIKQALEEHREYSRTNELEELFFIDKR